MSTLANLMGESPGSDWTLQRIAHWQLTFVVLPRQCFLTNKWLWFKKCYKGTSVITGPGFPVVDNYYIEKSAFLIWNLNGRK